MVRVAAIGAPSADTYSIPNGDIGLGCRCNTCLSRVGAKSGQLLPTYTKNWGEMMVYAKMITCHVKETRAQQNKIRS